MKRAYSVLAAVPLALLLAAGCTRNSGGPKTGKGDGPGDPAPSGREGPRFVCIDLAPYANSKINYLDYRPGEHTLTEVRFRFGERGITMKGQFATGFPERIPGIKVGLKGKKLHFLHAAHYCLDKAADTIGSYVVHFEDGAEVAIPLVRGKQIVDHWFSETNPSEVPPPTDAVIAWRGDEPSAKRDGYRIWLQKMTWVNPHPDKTIVSVDAVSNVTQANYSLFALSAEQ